MSDDNLIRLKDVAEILGMKAPNVRRFLKRRGIAPAVDVSYRRRWDRREILAAKAAYDASGRIEHDERRRANARKVYQ